MANIEIRDGDAVEKHLKASGAGTTGDPFVPEHTLGAGAAAIGKLAANSGVDIGDVDVLSVAGTVTVDATGQGDVPVTLDGETVELAASTAAIGKLAANSGVDIGDVDVLSIAAGETHLGEVGCSTVVKEITFTLDTAAHADGDVLAATQEIAGAVRVNAGTGIIQSVVILDKDDQGEALDVVLLKTNVALGTENAAVSITDADADEIQGIVEVSSYVDLVGSQLATMTNLGIGVQADSGATSLFVGLISRGTGTYTASGITAKITILRD